MVSNHTTNITETQCTVGSQPVITDASYMDPCSRYSIQSKVKGSLTYIYVTAPQTKIVGVFPQQPPFGACLPILSSCQRRQGTPWWTQRMRWRRGVDTRTNRTTDAADVESIPRNSYSTKTPKATFNTMGLSAYCTPCT